MERDSRQGAVRPPDHGLAALGLIMQLGGSIFLVYMFVDLAERLWPQLHGNQGRPGHGWAWPVVVIAAAALRSALHLRAGRALVRRSGAHRLDPTYTYLVIALAQSVLTLAWLNMVDTRFCIGSSGFLVTASILLAWPLTLLAILVRPGVRRAARENEVRARATGAPALMIVLGLTGALTALFLLYAVLGRDDIGASGMSDLRLALSHVCVLLIARSVLQTIAGVRGMGGDDAGFHRAHARYVSFGIFSAVLVGGALYLGYLVERGLAYPHVALEDIWTAGMLLLCWPLVLMATWRPRPVKRGDSPVRTPDGGLVALGWLLLVLGVLQLALAVGDSLLVTSGYSLWESWPPDLGDENRFYLGYIASGPRWPWWVVGISLAQLWAAVELIRASPRQRLAATIYGALSAIITLYLIWPQLDLLSTAIGNSIGGLRLMVARMFEFAFWLAVPLVTMILANRKPTSQPSPVRPSDSEAFP